MSMLIVYTPEEVAELLKVKPRTIIRLVRNGKLKGIKVGKFWRIPKQSLDEYITR